MNFLIKDKTVLVNILSEKFKIKDCEKFSKYLDLYLTYLNNNVNELELGQNLNTFIDEIAKELRDENKKIFYLFSIEGNIGIGKSTWINDLINDIDKNIEILSEPVSIWECIFEHEQYNENFLQMVYRAINNPNDESLNRVIFKFQSTVLFSKWLLFMFAKYETTKSVFISERCIYSDQ